jgi:hypothetical protein
LDLDISDTLKRQHLLHILDSQCSSALGRPFTAPAVLAEGSAENVTDEKEWPEWKGTDADDADAAQGEYYVLFDGHSLQEQEQGIPPAVVRFYDPSTHDRITPEMMLAGSKLHYRAFMVREVSYLLS